ncbi:hypothetical protein HMPREF0991_03504 [Lachnospiraceae bacterium 2_1_58FAA]|nr:hypothetical protein HMPREF0991_03504 [Lachnospiraceae bacterium 2_1_58FAA]
MLGFLLLFHCFLWYNKSSEKGAENIWLVIQKIQKILAYKDLINQLNKTISTQTELIQSLQKTLEADRLEKENLRQQIEYLTKKLFGTSSEKRKDIDGQLNLFDEAEQEADPTWKQELPDDITVPEHKRKARRTHADLFKNVPLKCYNKVVTEVANKI